MNSQDVDLDGVVRWVASQSPNPALQALMKEAEREKQSRPSTPIHGHISWSTSPWHSPDVSYLPLSGGSSSSAPRGEDPRRAKPLSAPQRKPLAVSVSSAKQPSSAPSNNSARPRSSPHSTAPSGHEEEPEASTFIELLKDVSRQLDENAQKKQRLAARAREKERDQGRNGTNHKGVGARPLVKTSSASVVCPSGSSTKTLSNRGHALEKTASLGAPGVDNVSGKFTSNSLPNLNLNCNPKHASSPSSNAQSTPGVTTPEITLDSPMQDVIDLTETDVEWDRHKSHPTSLADTTMSVSDDDDALYGDTRMDVSFYQLDPPSRRDAPGSRLQPPQPSAVPRSFASTQRPRTGPPLLGMRRAPQLQSSQYSSTQGPKGTTVPRFKPPLLVSGGGMTNKSGSGIKSVVTSSKHPPRGTTKVAAANTLEREGRDADSSFDVSFDMDPDALEETMRAYD